MIVGEWEFINWVGVKGLQKFDANGSYNDKENESWMVEDNRLKVLGDECIVRSYGEEYYSLESGGKIEAIMWKKKYPDI